MEKITNVPANLTMFDDGSILRCWYRQMTNQQYADELWHRFWQLFDNFLEFRNAGTGKIREFIEIDPKINGALITGLQLAERIQKMPVFKFGQVLSSEQAGEHFIDKYTNDPQEHLVLLGLNTKHEIILEKTLYVGTLNTCPVHPRDIFQQAVKISAEKIMLVHNHPSGSIDPSDNDIKFCERIEQCGVMMGIELLDFILIGTDEYLSMREMQLF